MWECYSKTAPFLDIKYVDMLTKVAQEDLRPIIPKDCPQPIAELISASWVKDPAVRPTANEIVCKLEQQINI